MENNILIIDDNQKIAKLMKDFGELKYKHCIDIAYDIKSALALIEKKYTI